MSAILDSFCNVADNALRTLFVKPASRTKYPASGQTAELTQAQNRAVAGMMRINHCGEVCAQGLYQAHALMASNPELHAKMLAASAEENDHLNWCQNRLEELNAKPSVLNPFFYCGSFALGMASGLLGDKWSLGFVAETEEQVVRHIDKHLQKLPKDDQRSRAILEQMREDELTHATMAKDLGAQVLPFPVRKLMSSMAKVMTKSTYHW